MWRARDFASDSHVFKFVFASIREPRIHEPLYSRDADPARIRRGYDVDTREYSVLITNYPKIDNKLPPTLIERKKDAPLERARLAVEHVHARRGHLAAAAEVVVADEAARLAAPGLPCATTGMKTAQSESGATATASAPLRGLWPLWVHVHACMWLAITPTL